MVIEQTPDAEAVTVQPRLTVLFEQNLSDRAEPRPRRGIGNELGRGISNPAHYVAGVRVMNGGGALGQGEGCRKSAVLRIAAT
jgi:hypothetical protein